MFEKYERYFVSSKTKDTYLSLANYNKWSVRIASHVLNNKSSNKSKEKVCKKVFDKLIKKKNPVFNFEKQAIYVEKYTMENVSYKIAIYAHQGGLTLDYKKISLKSMSDLANSTYIKAGYTQNYGLLVFYNEKQQPIMTIQIATDGDPKQSTIKWLNYLGIVTKTDIQEENDKPIFDKIKENLLTITQLMLLWNNEKEEEKISNNSDEKWDLALKHSSTREYGWLSASQESGDDACVIGYDFKGGCSYGKHQLAVRTGKFEAYKKYIESNYPNYKSKYADIFTQTDIDEAKQLSSKPTCNDVKNGLTKAFKTVCKDPVFIDLAHNTITEQNYKPIYEKINNTFAGTRLFSNLSERDEEALKEMAYSLGVQHGGALRIFHMALINDYTACSFDIKGEITSDSPEYCKGVKTVGFPPKNPKEPQLTQMKQTANNLTMEEYINRVYAARKLYVYALKIDGWQNILKKDKGRYDVEPKLLINTLKY